jgi:hypothetical protein
MQLNARNANYLQAPVFSDAPRRSEMHPRAASLYAQAKRTALAERSAAAFPFRPYRPTRCQQSLARVRALAHSTGPVLTKTS